jgi:hypothetical protein
MTQVLFLQDSITHQVEAPQLRHGRTRWSGRTYQTQPARQGRGSKKYGRQYSKAIGNPRLRTAGASVIWNAV